MEQKKGQETKKETKKQVKPFDILGQDEMSFIRGGDGNPPPPPPVGNGADENG